MEHWNYLGVNSGGFGLWFPIALLVVAWELAWKGWGMWKAAERKESGWFVAMLVFNTLGILPILYIYVFSKQKSTQ